MKVPDQRGKRKRGYYLIDAKHYVSVTTVLSVLHRPGLEWWKIGRMHEIMSDNPNLSENEARALIYATGKKAADRGTTVHKLIEVAQNQDIDLRKVASNHRLFVKAYRGWQQLSEPVIEDSEMTVYSDLYHVAGTLDQRVNIRGKRYILDIKTGKANGRLYPEVWLQLAMLLQAHRETYPDIQIDGIGAVLLRANGVPLPDLRDASEAPLEAYLAALTLWKYQHPGHKLEWT